MFLHVFSWQTFGLDSRCSLMYFRLFKVCAGFIIIQASDMKLLTPPACNVSSCEPRLTLSSQIIDPGKDQLHHWDTVRRPVCCISALKDAAAFSVCCLVCRHQWACEGQGHLYRWVFYDCSVLLSVHGSTQEGACSPGCLAWLLCEMVK